MKKFWVLTETYNEYDQHGDYLIAVWSEKPTEEQILDLLYPPKEGVTRGYTTLAKQLLEHGNDIPKCRSGGESWYILSELEEGKRYD